MIAWFVLILTIFKEDSMRNCVICSVRYTGVQWPVKAHVGWRAGNAADCVWDKRRLFFLFDNILIGRDEEVFRWVFLKLSSEDL